MAHKFISFSVTKILSFTLIYAVLTPYQVISQREVLLRDRLLKLLCDKVESYVSTGILPPKNRYLPENYTDYVLRPKNSTSAKVDINTARPMEDRETDGSESSEEEETLDNYYLPEYETSIDPKKVVEDGTFRRKRRAQSRNASNYSRRGRTLRRYNAMKSFRWRDCYTGEYDISAEDMSLLCKVLEEYEKTGDRELATNLGKKVDPKRFIRPGDPCWIMHWYPCELDDLVKDSPCGWYEMVFSKDNECR